MPGRLGFLSFVALRKESVDRNLASGALLVAPVVALRKESVDRNFRPSPQVKPVRVALRKESVDRNLFYNVYVRKEEEVALRKESVDRNGLGLRHYRDDVCRSPQGERG